MTETPLEEDFRAGFVFWITGLKRKTRDELLAECRAQNPGWSESEIEPWADSKHRFSTKIAALVHSQRDPAEEDTAVLHQITCPSLLITGDQSRGAILGKAEIKSL